MAKAKKRDYDVSKYISLPVALSAAIAALIILILVGIKYSGFKADFLQANPYDYSESKVRQTKRSRCGNAYSECKSEAVEEQRACSDSARAIDCSDDPSPSDCEKQRIDVIHGCFELMHERINWCKEEYDKCISRPGR